uniref:DUF4956 domain-containing protein n=1 Tax=Herbivorax sp. ANBcel31 TaxID=3069754 RepID=UPI003593DF5F
MEATASFTYTIATMVIAFALGLLIAFTYMKTHAKGKYSQNFTLTVIMIPAVIAIIILLVGSSVARAFSLMGIFSIIRFRSAPGDPKDISYILFSAGAGLACGVGLMSHAVLFTALICAFMYVLSVTNFGDKKTYVKQLKIVIPEDLDYQGVFDEVLLEYTSSYELKRVKTTDLGTLFELAYVVTMKEDANEKEFLDELRCRNGNLNIVLSMNAEKADY